MDFSKDCLEKKAGWWEWDAPDLHDDGSKPERIGGDQEAKKKEAGFHYEKRKKVRSQFRPNRGKMEKRKCSSENLFGWSDKAMARLGLLFAKGKAEGSGGNCALRHRI